MPLTQGNLSRLEVTSSFSSGRELLNSETPLRASRDSCNRAAPGGGDRTNGGIRFCAHVESPNCPAKASATARSLRRLTVRGARPPCFCRRPLPSKARTRPSLAEAARAQTSRAPQGAVTPTPTIPLPSHRQKR